MLQWKMGVSPIVPVVYIQIKPFSTETWKKECFFSYSAGDLFWDGEKKRGPNSARSLETSNDQG